jgi:hypothetical protein
MAPGELLIPMTESEVIDRAISVLTQEHLSFGKVERIIFLPRIEIPGIDTYPDDAWSVVVERPTPADCVSREPAEYVVTVNARSGDAFLQDTM